MRSTIHPDYGPVVFRDRSAGKVFVTASTLAGDPSRHTGTIEVPDGRVLPVVDVQVSSASHPFWTGRTRTIDTEGRVQKFERRYGRREQSR